MLIILGAILGIVWGVVHARRRNGNGADQAQYGAVFGIIGALAMLFATMVISAWT